MTTLKSAWATRFPFGCSDSSTEPLSNHLSSSFFWDYAVTRLRLAVERQPYRCDGGAGSSTSLGVAGGGTPCVGRCGGIAVQAFDRGANGASWGTANRMGNTTYYNNANGTSAGRSTTMGNTTYHYNANGTSAGRGTTMGNTTYHYNANGTSAGRSTTMGNTTYYYGPNGASAGTATRTGW